MFFCYIDETGCTGQLPSDTSDVQPIFALLGLIIKEENLAQLTRDLLDLKVRFYGRALRQHQRSTNRQHYLDAIRFEIKGSELRKYFAEPRSRRERRHTAGVLDHLLRIVEANDGKLLARVLVKGVGRPIDGEALYSRFVQSLCRDFQAFLGTQNDIGQIIADFRVPELNSTVSHSIFTQKYSIQGDAFPNIVEMPTFGHSHNHAGLQMADLVISALLAPSVIDCYCAQLLKSVHIRARYDELREQYISRIQALQFRYQVPDQGWRGGVHVRDWLGDRRSAELFNIPPRH